LIVPFTVQEILEEELAHKLASRQSVTAPWLAAGSLSRRYHCHAGNDFSLILYRSRMRHEG
jgi:hypothetical protein